MEEKWWSKFQTKTADGNPANDEYLSVDDIKEVVVEELQEKLDDAVAAGKKTSDEFVHWANEKMDEQPELKSAFHTAKDKVADVQEWASDVWNQPKVQQTVDMVNRKSNEAFAAGAKVVDDVKAYASKTLEKPEVAEAIDAMKETAEDVLESGAKAYVDVKMWSEETLNRPEVQETLANAKEKASEAVEAGKTVVNQTLEWATELKNRPEVQQTVQTMKQKSREVVDDVKDGFVRVANDPHVQKNVESIKKTATKTSKTFKQGYEDLKGEGLRDEWKEFTHAAAKFGKQGARVVVTTVEEIRTNETVIATVEKGKEISLDLLDRGMSAIRTLLERREERKMKQRMYEQEWEYEPRRRTRPEEYETEFEEEAESDSSSEKGWDFDDLHEGQ